MSTPSISIIVPIYNVGSYLRRCLDSLVGQTIKNVEIVCVDDGSTDDSSDILQEYAACDERIRVVTQKNAGLSAARNAGMRVANAEFITFVDSDDYVEPNTYEQALKHMESGVDYVCFSVQVEGQVSEDELRAYESYLKHPSEGSVELTDDFMLFCDTLACNKIFRRSIIREHDIRFPGGIKYEDNFFFRAYGVWASRAYYMRERYYHYMRHDGSIMSELWSGKERCAMDFIEIAIQLRQYFEQHGLLPNRVHYFGRIFFKLLHSALSFEQSEPRRCELFERADSFLSHSGLDFADNVVLHYQRALLTQRILPGTVRKRFWGLVSVKYKASHAKHYLMGIPFFISHHRPV